MSRERRTRKKSTRTRTNSRVEKRSTGKKKSRFGYKARSEEQYQKRANQRGNDFVSPWPSDVDLFIPQDGENVLRIILPGS